MSYRTNHCGALRKGDAGTRVTLCGWVDSRRDHGGVVFIDLRDRNGITQIVFRPEEHPEVASLAHGLRSEDVIQVTGEASPGSREQKTRSSPPGTLKLLRRR